MTAQMKCRGSGVLSDCRSSMVAPFGSDLRGRKGKDMMTIARSDLDHYHRHRQHSNHRGKIEEKNRGKKV